jgi:N-acetylmuramoyl-L-alanine amidase
LYQLIEKLKTTLPSEFEFKPRGSVVELIDMGHGGLIHGEYVTAPNKMYNHGDFTFYEGLWTRTIGFLYAYELSVHELGYKIITECNLDYPLAYRVNKANEYMKKNPSCKYYYHSIHGNAAGVKSANGIEVYTSPGQTLSDSIATIMFENLQNELGWKMRPDSIGDGDPDKEARFTVLTETDMPAILTETGFYTNFEECKKMLDYSIMQKIIKAFRLTHETVLNKRLL